MIVAIAGATGLTGAHCLQELLQEKRIKKVYSIGRRKTEANHHKLTEILLEDGSLTAVPQTDAFICCLGTTIKKAGSKQAFKAVDLHLPLTLAFQLREAGCRTAAVISAMGANENAVIFYSRVKGEMEAGMQLAGFSSLTILRPSFITGERKEKRMGEIIGIGVFKLLQPLLQGRFRHYKPIAAETIARALANAVLTPEPGTRVLLTEQIEAMAKHP